MSQPDIEVPVLIVGAGPAGLASALALSRYGVGYLLVERHPGTAHTPRAHIVNQRTVEILRHLGIEDRLHAVATPQDNMRNNLWVTSLAGREVARSETWGTGERRSAEYRAASPCPMANCPQTVFEPMLLSAVRNAGGEPRFNHEWLGMTRDADGVTSTVRRRDTGEELTVRSQFVIGADGARSRVLDAAGLRVDGPSGLAHAANVWFQADLSRYLAHRPGVLTWNVMPGPLPALRLGTLICHQPYTEFVLVFMYDPDQVQLSSIGEDELVDRVRALVGADDVEVHIKGIAGWQVNAQVAPEYASGRVFCMGDAVHRHPPTNGLGLNMSVADAYNLAWKLALVLDGRAGTRLTDSYSQERQPVGTDGIERAITSLRETAAIDAALGFAPGQSEADGWAAIAELDEPGARGEARRRALAEAVELSNYQFNAHGLELGYRYRRGALLPEPTETRAATELPLFTAVPEPECDPVLHYRPTTSPGARVPHARLERDGVPCSTLDLVNGLEFALLTGPGGEAWLAAAEQVAARTKVPISVHLIRGGLAGSYADPYGGWAAVREVGTDGCVLVRPDRHVAWRSAGLVEDPAAALSAVLDQVLCLGAPAVPPARERTDPVSA